MIQFLELGGGGQPEKLRKGMNMENYLNMDAFSMPTVDIVHDATKAPWPFDSDTVGGIYSVEFMEHISPEGLKVVLSESFRVMVPGGRFAFECPDIEGINRRIAGAYTPDEMAYMKRGIHGDNSRAYDKHLNGLYFDYAKKELELAGFVNITRVDPPLWREDFVPLVNKFGAQFMKDVKLCIECIKPKEYTMQ